MEFGVDTPIKKLGRELECIVRRILEYFEDFIRPNVFGEELFSSSLGQVKVLCRQVGEIAYLQLRWVWAPMPIGLDRLLNATFDYRVMGALEVI
jgi:hypothetical protein